MKKHIIIFTIISVFFLYSCEEWLNVTPQGNVIEEEMYKKPNGFRSVLNGLYKSMAKSDLYGMNLQFGFLDCLSQQYNLDKSNMYTDIYRDIAAYDYEDVYVKGIKDKIWAKAYNIIANANNLIKNIEEKPDNFFANNKIEKDDILGEALAVRALLHFDMLRLYAPAPINDDGKAYIPYVDDYPVTAPQSLPVKTVLEKIIIDFEKAKSLVAGIDTTEAGKETVCSGRARFYNDFPLDAKIRYGALDIDEYFTGRGYRLNYDAITALLARVYQYAGKDDKALECTDYIMNKEHNYNLFVEQKKVYFFSSKDMTGSFEGKTNLKHRQNLIFAVYNEKAYDEFYLSKHFAKIPERAKYYFNINDKQNIFFSSNNDDEKDIDDRSTLLLFRPEQKFTISAKWYWSETDEIRQNNVTIIPMIRLTEMYYIAAEAYARNNNFGKAEELIKYIRSSYGCDNNIEISSMDDFVKELIIDARREWISEGQLFYLYKRLNANIYFNENEIRPLTREEAIIPLPDNQSL
jgi:hypothetical protein